MFHNSLSCKHCMPFNQFGINYNRQIGGSEFDAAADEAVDDARLAQEAATATTAANAAADAANAAKQVTELDNVATKADNVEAALKAKPASTPEVTAPTSPEVTAPTSPKPPTDVVSPADPSDANVGPETKVGAGTKPTDAEAVTKNQTWFKSLLDVASGNKKTILALLAASGLVIYMAVTGQSVKDVATSIGQDVGSVVGATAAELGAGVAQGLGSAGGAVLNATGITGFFQSFGWIFIIIGIVILVGVVLFFIVKSRQAFGSSP